MEVAIRELKAKLSAYLKAAAAGELITVTDRGRPIALLGPILDAVDLRAAVEAGWITPATATRLGPVSRYPSNTSVEAVLTEDRTE